MASVNRSRTPWLLFAGHRPFYIDSPYPVDLVAHASDGEVAAHSTAALEPLWLCVPPGVAPPPVRRSAPDARGCMAGGTVWT